jgi:hypothetical protein
VVEDLIRNPKIKGSNPGTGTGREKMAKNVDLTFHFNLDFRKKSYMVGEIE